MDNVRNSLRAVLQSLKRQGFDVYINEKSGYESRGLVTDDVTILSIQPHLGGGFEIVYLHYPNEHHGCGTMLADKYTMCTANEFVRFAAEGIKVARMIGVRLYDSIDEYFASPFHRATYHKL